ncbi:Osmotically-inducible protein Y [Ferriphaselus amnicola]|uniref:Osmotically-inducible protein Y n=1 Tax=Ferriphaselus amnicola TaxID=1188319 RepID=A0A2Z6GB40_9PROT|nr:BON domain-containing protein [Ferriphaselus amnicola]BBE50708.1 Osmotically-inducible protein Y [Ferriphaselus amnicola]
MKTADSIKLIGLSMFLVAGLAACEKHENAESTGKKLDQAAEDVGNKISESAEKTSDKIEEQSDKAGVAISDAEITTKVKAAIFAEPGLKTLQISVDTVKGVVTLSGTVDSDKNSDQAKSLAEAVSGVKDVNNHLVVKTAK